MNWIVTLSESERWGIGLLLVLFLALASHRLSVWRDRHSRFVAASTTFRAAFSDVVLSLEQGNIPSAGIVSVSRIQHLAAITAFRPYVPSLRCSNFDKASERYQQCCAACMEGGVFALAASETTEYAKANRERLLASIEHLLSYAKQT